MISLCIQELAEITGGRLHLGMMPPLGGGMEPIGRVVMNVRDVRPGDVFWAMETAERESVASADHAFARGALGAVVVGRHVEPWAGTFSVVVHDSRKALWQLAAWSRRRFRGQLIAVAGGTGIAATARMIDAVLGERFVGTLPDQDATNRLGLPLSMLALDAAHDFAVVECKAGTSNEAGALSHLCRPNIAVINCLAVDGAQDGEPVCELKMLQALPEGSWVVLNGDIPRIRNLCSCQDERVLFVGESSHCDLVASEVRTRSGELSFVADGMPFRVPVRESHGLHSALAAIAVGRIMNMSPDEMAVALSRFRPRPGCRWGMQMDGMVDGLRLGTSSLPEAV